MVDVCVCVFFIHDFDQIVINHDMKWKHTIIDIVEYESHDRIQQSFLGSVWKWIYSIISLKVRYVYEI